MNTAKIRATLIEFWEIYFSIWRVLLFCLMLPFGFAVFAYYKMLDFHGPNFFEDKLCLMGLFAVLNLFAFFGYQTFMSEGEELLRQTTLGNILSCLLVAVTSSSIVLLGLVLLEKIFWG